VRGIDGVKSVLRFDVESVDVVEPAIPGFRDDGKRPPVSGHFRLAMGNTPLNDGVADDADAVRVGDHHGTIEETGLFHPDGAGHFAVAIERPPAGKNRTAHGILAARENGSHAGSHGAFANLELAFAGNERGVADGDAGNIGDGVERAGRAVKRHAEIAGARLGRRIFLSRG
jgi:hypothetical protein